MLHNIEFAVLCCISCFVYFANPCILMFLLYPCSESTGLYQDQGQLDDDDDDDDAIDDDDDDDVRVEEEQEEIVDEEDQSGVVAEDQGLTTEGSDNSLLSNVTIWLDNFMLNNYDPWVFIKTALKSYGRLPYHNSQSKKKKM